MSERLYLVVCGHAENIEEVVGPYKTESDAILAKNTIQQMKYKRLGSITTWGEGDTWVSVKEREVITL
jgi:hypothetical protein